MNPPRSRARTPRTATGRATMTTTYTASENGGRSLRLAGSRRCLAAVLAVAAAIILLSSGGGGDHPGVASPAERTLEDAVLRARSLAVADAAVSAALEQVRAMEAGDGWSGGVRGNNGTTGTGPIPHPSMPDLAAAGPWWSDLTTKMRQRLQLPGRHIEDDGKHRRPAMHTFYHTVEEEGSVVTHESRTRMLTVWASAWYRAGWEPRILTMMDVRRHPDYQKYRPFLDANPWGPYNSACFWRWFAMATIEGGGWMADYDVFPLNPFLDQAVGGNLPSGGNFTTHEFWVPGLVSATQREYDRVAKILVSNAEAHKRKQPKEHFSDMRALADLRKRHEWNKEPKQFEYVEDLVRGLDFFRAASFGNGGKGDGGDACEKFRDKIAVHFAPHYVARGIEEGLLSKELSMEEHRPGMSEEWTRKWEDACSAQSSGAAEAVST